MIDNKTGKYYVYVLMHKPTGKYFHEFTFVMNNSQQTGVVLKTVCDKIFTTPDQLGKLWGRVEEARNGLFHLENLYKSSTYKEEQDLLIKSREAIKLMDEMETCISELNPASDNKLKDSLIKQAKESQVEEAVKHRFGTFCTAGNLNSAGLYTGYLIWNKMPNKEELTHIVSLHRDKRDNSNTLEQIEKLGIKIHVFDFERHPRIVGIKEEDLNFLRLSNSHLIKNSVEIAKIKELHNIILNEFGLLEI